MLEFFYKDEGYFTAKVTDSSVNIVDTGGGRFRMPLLWSNKPGKGANINLNIEEGPLFHLNKVNITGMNFFRTNEVMLRTSTDGHRRRVFHGQAAQGLRRI